MTGDSHSANGSPSRLHSNVESISVALKLNIALVEAVYASGLAWIVVSGGTATVHSCSAGVSSTRPYSLSAATSNSCGPSLRLVYAFGELHRVNPSPSIEQKKIAPSWSAEKVKEAELVELVSAGPESMVVTGGAMTVQRRSAGVRSALRARSVARTVNTCWPGRTSYSIGDSHDST